MVGYFEDKEFVEKFKIELGNYSDKEVLEILKKRDHYNEVASKLAIEEAIERGLILSEQDLFDEKFKVGPMPNKLFPPVGQPQVRKKIIRSIGRGLLLAGLIPLIYGVVEIVQGGMFEPIILILLGGTWVFNAYQLMIKQKLSNLNLILLMALASLVYAGSLFFQMKSIQVMDIALAVILYSLLFYGAFYARKLITAQPAKEL